VFRQSQHTLWLAEVERISLLCVTEGEIDCLSVAEAFEGKYPVVSIPNGAAAAAACFKKHLDYFESFESVVIMFDNDEVGIQAAKTCASILSVGKAKIASMNSKDPNEALVNGDQKQIIQGFLECGTVSTRRNCSRHRYVGEHLDHKGGRVSHLSV
jgi:hypothetical protein